MAMVLPSSDVCATTVATPQFNGYRGNKNNQQGGSNTGRRPNNNNGNKGDNPGRPGDRTPNRPSGSHNPGRPGGQTPDRPSGSHNPGRPINGGGNPGRPSRQGHFRPLPPPMRPYRPIPRIHYRPTPPPAYVPYRNAPVINAILGLRFGVSLINSIASLSRGGYDIDGYNNSEVYLRNVYEMGYRWEDAILYYDSLRQLVNVSFYESLAYYDMGRYNNLYYQLCNEYGSPAVMQNIDGGMSTSWYDRYGNNFVTLSFGYGTAFGGSSRYYTTLVYGNN